MTKEMKDEKIRQLDEIKEMLEDIEHIRREFVDLNGYDALTVKHVNGLVSAVWLWFMTEYKTLSEAKY